MKHSERFALNQWLAAYPPDKTYQEVLELLGAYHPDVTVWEMTESHPHEYVADLIEDTRFALEQMMDDLVYGVCLSDKTEEQSKLEGAMQ